MGLKYSVFTKWTKPYVDKIREVFHSLKTSGLV